MVTDRAFFERMRGNNNRIKSMYEFLNQNHDTDVLFLTDENKYESPNIYNWKDHIPDISDQRRFRFKQPKCISDQISMQKKIAFNNFIKTQKKYDFIIISYIWLSYLVEQKPDNEAKYIIDTHDVFHKRSENFEKIGIKFTSACTREQEKQCLSHFDFIMAITEEEANTFRDMGFDNVFVAKYYFKKPKQKIRIGFIGSTSPHNTDAIEWFYDNCFKDKLDKTHLLYICGDTAYMLRERYHGRGGVYLYCPIYDISDFYRLVDIVINPCRIGSGLKIKNVEAIAFEKPCITTGIGSSGMDDEVNNGVLFTTDTADNFVKYIQNLSYVTQRQYIENEIKKYNRSNSADKVYGELNEILKG